MCGDGSAHWGAYDPPERLGPAFIETISPPSGGFEALGGSPSFSVEYLDVTNGTGVGFDDPTEGATRRDTFAAVAAYVATLLPYSGTAQIQFQESETDGTGFLGSAQPLADFLTGGCKIAWPVTHIKTGVDPNPTFPDGIITMDFGYNWNSGLGDPGGAEFDLFTVLLHELTHAIGFVSTLSVDAAGNGPFGVNPDLRIRDFDRYVWNPNGGGAWAVMCDRGFYTGAAGDLAGPPSLEFAGPASVEAWLALGETGRPPLYTPSTHAAGSSITHWDTDDPEIPSDAVMRHTIPVGVKRRTYGPLGLASLKDIGYFDVPISTLPWWGIPLAVVLFLAAAWLLRGFLGLTRRR